MLKIGPGNVVTVTYKPSEMTDVFVWHLTQYAIPFMTGDDLEYMEPWTCFNIRQLTQL